MLTLEARDGVTRPFHHERRRTRALRDLPTVLRSGPYRVYFVSHDIDEQAHVHVDRDDQSAKFWLAPVVLARNLGFTAVELRRVQRLVAAHEPRLLEAWHEYFREAAG